MDNSYFTFDNEQYVIVYIDSHFEIYKRKGDMIIKISDQEKLKIKNKLSENYNYIYNNDLLVELIKTNDGIQNKEYLFGFLNWLESIIPVGCRSDFYNNLKSVKFDLKLECVSSEIGCIDSAAGNDTAGYNTIENKISVNEKLFQGLWELAKRMDNPNDFFWKSYNYSLLHELAHMASTKYDPETKVVLCGFDKFPPEKECDKNRGLTEGFTELIAMIGVPGTIEISSGYYIEVNIVCQLISLVGLDIFLKSYFANLGTIHIQKELNSIIDNINKSEKLFRDIELNFLIRKFDGEQNVFGNIQLSLLDYLERKCEILYSNGNFKEIEQLLEDYYQRMITPEKLKIMLKNPQNYIGVTESLLKFERIKSKYINMMIPEETTDKSFS